MKRSVFLFIISFVSSFSFAQTVNYNDVAVIVNVNSQTSIDIGNYFQSARNIPNQNIIQISAPTTEEIDSTEFQAVRTQIENYLLTNDLADSINYLVTTKGVPLKVSNECFDITMSSFSCASFDSELCLILSADSNSIGAGGGVNNPVFNDTQYFSRSTYGIYLVTRLTGYTKQDVYDLIDRSGPETGVNRLSAQAILDINYSTGGDSVYFHNFYVTPAEDYLTTNLWNSFVHPDTLPSQNQSNVFAYMAYGVNAAFNLSLNHSWTNGSIGLIQESFSASTFDLAQNTSGQLLLGDLIAEGCTGAMGLANGNFFGLIVSSETFFNRYLDLATNYNLAESFYMAEPRLSWQSVVVGDPKASLRLDNLAGIDDPDELILRLHPNPSSGMIYISSEEELASIVVYDTRGAQVKIIPEISGNATELDLSELNGGVYLVHIFSESKVKMERIVLTK